jgi:hypothetical protein
MHHSCQCQKFHVIDVHSVPSVGFDKPIPVNNGIPVSDNQEHLARLYVIMHHMKDTFCHISNNSCVLINTCQRVMTSQYPSPIIHVTTFHAGFRYFSGVGGTYIM